MGPLAVDAAPDAVPESLVSRVPHGSVEEFCLFFGGYQQRKARETLREEARGLREAALRNLGTEGEETARRVDLMAQTLCFRETALLESIPALALALSELGFTTGDFGDRESFLFDFLVFLLVEDSGNSAELRREISEFFASELSRGSGGEGGGAEDTRAKVHRPPSGRRSRGGGPSGERGSAVQYALGAFLDALADDGTVE